MSPSPTARLRSIVFDCPDPATLGAFYAQLTAGHLVEADSEWWEVHVEGLPVKLAFQRVPHHAPPRWPDGAPQQVHLDLAVSDLYTACLAATSLGATRLGDPVEEPGCVFVVFADPAGHPFCLCQER